MILPMGVYSFDRDRGFTCQLRRSLEVKKKMKILVAALHRCWSWWCTGGELVGSWWCTGGALVGHWWGADGGAGGVGVGASVGHWWAQLVTAPPVSFSGKTKES